MLWVETKRIIRSGFVNFWRNGFVSLASVVMMVVTLFVIGALLFLGAVFRASLENIKSKVDVNVYFVTDASEESILSMQTAIRALPEVAEVEYISRDEALTRFRVRHEEDQLTLQALDELGENPLGASLSIRAKETSQYESIAAFLENDSAISVGGAPIVDKVNYFQNKVAIDKLTKIIDSAKTFGIAVTLILAIASILITLNTVRLAIYTAREEIAVMRLVGASNWYIRGPFLVEGFMYGIVAAIATLIIFYPLTLWLGPVTKNFFGDINIFHYYLAEFGRIAVILLSSGVLLGAASSYLAVMKYLRE